MLKLYAILSTLYVAVLALRFENCETSPLTTAIHWFNFDIYPLPLLFEDQLTVSVKLKVLQNVVSPLVDIEVRREDTRTTGTDQTVQIPCTSDNTASCQNLDLCKINERFGAKNVTSGHGTLQEQLGQIIMSPLDSVRCPVLANRNIENTLTIPLGPISSTLHKMIQGVYNVKISIKDDPASTGNIGCIKFNFTILDGPPTRPSTTTAPPTTTLGGPLPPDSPDLIG